MDQSETKQVETGDYIKAKCSFKTLKAPKSEVVLREYREPVTVKFPKLQLAAAIEHPRFSAYLESCISEDAKSIIQEIERKAAESAGNVKYQHDMQSEANVVTLDQVMNYALDRAARNGGISKDDVEGWWKEGAAEATRGFYKNTKNYDDTRCAQACAYLIGQFTKVHNGKLSPTPELQKSLVVNLERLPQHVVRDYLLEKLNAKPAIDEAASMALIQ